MKLKILIVDDHSIVRDGLAVLLNLQKDFMVVGQAINGKDATRLSSELHPDVILMDLAMPTQDGADATKDILQVCPDTKVIILTTYGTSSRLALAIDNGAVGAITKTCPAEELYATIRDVASGKHVFSNEIRQTLAEDADWNTLSPRQMQMLDSISRGLTNQDIAKEHGLSYGVVKFHIKELFRKIGASNRTEAVSIAQKKHLLKI